MLLSEPAVLDAVEGPHIRRRIESSLHGTWFEVGGAEDVALGKDSSCLLYTSDAADDTPCVDL
eukprot:2085597-Pyramimonas_sp.AAC.1